MTTLKPVDIVIIGGGLDRPHHGKGAHAPHAALGARAGTGERTIGRRLRTQHGMRWTTPCATG
jgi:hypothetical protein